MASDRVVDVQENKISEQDKKIIDVLSNIDERYFNVNLDITSALRHLQAKGLIDQGQKDELRTLLKQAENETKHQFWNRVLYYLLRLISIKDVVTELLENNLEDLGFKVLGGFQGHEINEGADIARSRLVMRRYVKWKEQVDNNSYTCDQLLNLYNRKKNQMLESTRTHVERLDLADQCVVLTRLMAQLSEDPQYVVQMIEQMKKDIPSTLDTYFADLVYHGRNIVQQLQGGNIHGTKQYAQEVLEMCKFARQVEIRMMFYHRMVSVFRALYTKHPSDEVCKEIIHHCEMGLHVTNGLQVDSGSKDSEVKRYFEQFFLLNLAATLLGITPDLAVVECRNNNEKASVYAENVRRSYVRDMTSMDLVTYHQCKARIAEQKGNIEEAVEYIDVALDESNNFLTFPERQANLRGYRDTICSRQRAN